VGISLRFWPSSVFLRMIARILKDRKIRFFLSALLLLCQCMLGAPIVFVQNGEAEMPTITLRHLIPSLSGEMYNVIIMQGDRSYKLILPVEILVAVRKSLKDVRRECCRVECVRLDWFLKKIAETVIPFDGLYKIERSITA